MKFRLPLQASKLFSIKTIDKSRFVVKFTEVHETVCGLWKGTWKGFLTTLF